MPLASADDANLYERVYSDDEDTKRGRHSRGQPKYAAAHPRSQRYGRSERPQERCMRACADVDKSRIELSLADVL